jgi:DNA-directed RNA polymerase subunit RPC12/RpoP|nr:MAG TPA: zinc-ribbon family protein [Caudoviricetes sp.]
MKITITLTTISLFIILIFILKATNKEPYDYKCHNCGKRFRKKDLKDLLDLGIHLKDWTCPHCKYQNVTVITSYKP